jgi:hypothetical protein
MTLLILELTFTFFSLFSSSTIAFIKLNASNKSYLMQEHRWKARGERLINVKESVQELNAGSYNRHFEATLTQ